MSSIVGIDVGASKTEIRVRHRGGSSVSDRVLRYQTGPWQDQTPLEKAKRIASLIDEADIGDKMVLGVGAHGCDTAERCRELKSELAALVECPVYVVSDAELLAYSVGDPAAISVISGTGCIAIARDANGEIVRAGGQGWLVGDDGGATGLVREAVRACGQARDAGTPDIVLERHIAFGLGLSEFEQAALFLMLNPASVWARAAASVFSAADDGSAVAADVISDGVDYVVDLVCSLIRQGAVGRKVVLGGGVFASQPGYTNDVRERLLDDRSLIVSDAVASPSIGALVLAEFGTSRSTRQIAR
ncbi:N-acetylglucosamine kinase [Paramicrobacterium agarici]|uniref:N-acetylglucosamine kinase n=1 Tax=Paramicrobacterium agarici TaxID=630514 RepID=UPI001153BE8D|nr:BadF/BadG/BcrA/BcrD ATPase family protein [Microbacterium agarici]TQO22925.1 N-acetylglucosamine kinase-like BadF-type ATPase [Microbacterium agarici]